MTTKRTQAKTKTKAKPKAATPPATDKQLLLQQQLKQFKQLLDSDLIAQAEYEQLKTSVCTMFLLCFGTRDLNYRHTVLNRRHAPLLYTHPNVCLMESNTGLDHFWLRCGQRQNTRRQDTNASTVTKSSRAKATITTSTKSRCLQINATT